MIINKKKLNIVLTALFVENIEVSNINLIMI